MEDEEYEDVLVVSYTEHGPNICWPPTQEKLSVLERKLRLSAYDITQEFEELGGFYGAIVTQMYTTPWGYDYLLGRHGYDDSDFIISSDPTGEVRVSSRPCKFLDTDSRIYCSTRGDYLMWVKDSEVEASLISLCFVMTQQPPLPPKTFRLELKDVPSRSDLALDTVRILLANSTIILLQSGPTVAVVDKNQLERHHSTPVAAPYVTQVALDLSPTLQEEEGVYSTNLRSRGQVVCAELSHTLVGIMSELSSKATEVYISFIKKGNTGHAVEVQRTHHTLCRTGHQYNFEACSQGIITWRRNRSTEIFIHLRSWTSGEMVHSHTSRSAADPVMCTMGGFPLILLGLSVGQPLSTQLDALVVFQNMLHLLRLRLPLSLRSHSLRRLWAPFNRPHSRPSKTTSIIIEMGSGVTVFNLRLIV